MSKFILAALLVTLFEVAQGSGPLASIGGKIVPQFRSSELVKTRESAECTFQSDYPQPCSAAYTEFENLLDTTPLTDIVSSELSVILDVLCLEECVKPYVDYFNCLDEDDLGELYNSAYCGKSDGRNCVVLYVDGIAQNYIMEAPVCVSNGACDDECQALLQNTTDYLGCCAASWFGNPAGPLYYVVPPEDFESCGVDLGEPCDGVYDGVNRVEAGISVIVAAVAVVILVLF